MTVQSTAERWQSTLNRTTRQRQVRRVVTIWQGMLDFFRGAPVQIDFALYSGYPLARRSAGGTGSSCKWGCTQRPRCG